MTRESPGPPSRNGRDETPSRSSSTGKAGDSDRVGDGKETGEQAHLKPDLSLGELERLRVELVGKLERIFAEDKKLRIERLRLRRRLDHARASSIKLRKGRLVRAWKTESVRSRIASLVRETAEGPQSEVERLEKHLGELKGDVDALRETLLMHRRDRDRVFRVLAEAQSVLQDLLTEGALWKILAAETAEDADENTRNMSAVAAELLGRLLLLEKEESYIGGLFMREYDGDAGEK